MMWGDSTVGREVDTSVKGRGIALGDDGRTTAVQMRTPEQTPAEPTFSPMTWYSRISSTTPPEATDLSSTDTTTEREHT